MNLLHRIRIETPKQAALLFGCALACSALIAAAFTGALLWVLLEIF